MGGEDRTKTGGKACWDMLGEEGAAATSFPESTREHTFYAGAVEGWSGGKAKAASRDC